MSDVPSELRYTESHEWARLEDDGVVTVGVTDHAQSALGELVFVELPEVDNVVACGDECAVVESVKAASDVYAPITGQLLAVNEALNDNPGLLNEDPYGAGWLFKLQPRDENELKDLLDGQQYEDKISDE